MNIETKRGKIELPCMDVVLMDISKVKPNDYNPNSVPEHYMELLLESITTNGFCFPVVTIYDPADDMYVIIDGEHRYMIFKDYLHADKLPIVVLPHDMEKRMCATVQFNKARGVHQVEKDADIIRKLIEQGLNEEQIAEKLGMELEAVYRMKQITGIAALFGNQPYSKSWVMEEAGGGR
jgi:ParB-like chromosome segregation protein Spo0J